MLRLLGHKVFTLLVVGYTVSLTIGSLINTQGVIDAPKNFDKLVHFIAYFGLAFLWMLWNIFKNTSEYPKFKNLLSIAILAVIYGIFIEILQGAFTAYRMADKWDVLANSIGVVLAFVSVLLLIKNTRGLKTKI